MAILPQSQGSHYSVLSISVFYCMSKPIDLLLESRCRMQTYAVVTQPINRPNHSLRSPRRRLPASTTSSNADARNTCSRVTSWTTSSGWARRRPWRIGSRSTASAFVAGTPGPTLRSPCRPRSTSALRLQMGTASCKVSTSFNNVSKPKELSSVRELEVEELIQAKTLK